MYANPKLRRTNETKVRLSEPVEELVEQAAAAAGTQKAAWMRQVIEAHLADQGYEIPGYKRVVALRA